MDAITLSDGQTLYLSGGAVLHSIVSVNNAKNIRICGRGIIDGSDYPAWNQAGSYARVPIDLNHSKDVSVEGITIVYSNCRNLNSFSSQRVTIDNVKIISGRQNGDGFTFRSCTDHLVTNCYARTWDDSLVVKNYSGSTRGITFRDVQISTDGTSFTEAVPAARYEFNPDTGNRIRIDFDAAEARFVKLIFTMNSSSRTGGAQAAEIEIYE